MKASIRSSWLRYLPTPITTRLARRRSAFNSSTSELGQSRLALLNSATMRPAMAVRASGNSSAVKRAAKRRKPSWLPPVALPRNNSTRQVSASARFSAPPINSCSAAEPVRISAMMASMDDRTSARGASSAGAFCRICSSARTFSFQPSVSLRCRAKRAIEQIGRIALAGELGGQFRELIGVRIGKQALASGRDRRAAAPGWRVRSGS